MKIKAVFKKKRTAKFCLVTENEDFFDISEDLIVQYSIRRGRELSEELFAEIKKKQRIIDVKQAAYNYASYKPRSIRQVEDKLKLMKFDSEEISIAKNFLIDFDLLDDEKFAASYIESYLKRKSVGSSKIYQELLKKGINKDTAKNALAEHFPEDNKKELAIEAAEKKMRMLRSKPPEKQKNSLIAYLQRQGFDWNTIRETIQKYFGNNDLD